MDLACHVNSDLGLKKKTFNHGITDNMDVRVTGIWGSFNRKRSSVEVTRLYIMPVVTG